jgi:hypothetical protein
MIDKVILRYFAASCPLLLAACMNIGLREQLEDPAGANSSFDCAVQIAAFSRQAVPIKGNLWCGIAGADHICKEDFNDPRSRAEHNMEGDAWRRGIRTDCVRQLTRLYRRRAQAENLDWALKAKYGLPPA